MARITVHKGPALGTVQPVPAGVGALRFYSVDALLESAPERPAFVWDDYVGPGLVTLLTGRGKRSGKSTFAWALVRAMRADVDRFLGRALAAGPVVVLSEEPRDTLRPKVETLAGDAGVRLLWREVMPAPLTEWATLVRAAAGEARRVGAGLLVIDTFSTWARLDAEREQDSGAVAAAFAVLSRVAAAGLALLLVHHSTKQGDEAEGTDARGSSAFIDLADVVVTVARIRDGGERQRVLNADSRWYGTPPALVCELSADRLEYALVAEGERHASREAARLERLRGVLPAGPPGLTTAEVARGLGVSRQAATSLLKDAAEDGAVERAGEGAGVVARWWMVPEVPR